jgi:solute carrier family 45 protein 1/2/4
VTGFTSLIFAIFDPQNSGVPPHHHPAPVHASFVNHTDINVLIANTTEPIVNLAKSVVVRVLEAQQESAGSQLREGDSDGNVATYQGSNSIVYIFRFGGIAATIAAVLTWRLARELRHR